jgi:hypothetical protein
MMRIPPRLGPRSALPVVLIAATALTTAAAACGSGAPGPGAGVQTRTVHVSPVTSSGVAVAGYRTLTTAANASCEPGSEAIGQAYRCFAGNAVYDPCWAEKAAVPTVLCVADPWSRTDARLTVSSQLSPIPAEGGIGEPWAVQLSGGQRCLMVQGAHGAFQGHVIDYYCGQGLSLLRGLTTGSQPWTARSVVITSGQQTRGPVQTIAIAWYGSPDRSR